MKKEYNTSEIIANTISTIMNTVIIFAFFFNNELFKKYYFSLILGIYWGWFFTRMYYKNKEKEVSK